MSLEQIVNVSIDKNTKTATSKGFGVPAIIDAAASAILSSAIQVFEELEDLISAGFTTSSEVYKAAQAMLSQSPRPEKFKVIKLNTLVAQISNVVISEVANATAYVVTIDGVPYTYTSDADALNTEIRDGLMALIAAARTDLTCAIIDASSFSITADEAGVGFSITVGAKLSTTTPTANHGWVEDLTDAQNIDDDWYCLLTTTRTKAAIMAMAAWIETQSKIFGFDTNEADSKNIAPASDTTSILASLKAKNYERTFGLWSADIANYPMAALVGQNLPKEPGSFTWKFKEVSGIVADVLTPTEKANIQGKNGNVYNAIAGVNIFEEGIVASGEFIDIIQGTDWIEARVKENVFNLFVSEEKVPFDDGGIEAIKLQVEDILDQAVTRTILRGGEDKPTVSAPKLSETTAPDRAARYLRTVTFQGYYAGAIHKTQIKGSLAV